MVEEPEEYKWSSYQYYIGHRKKPQWLKTDFILEYFGKKVSTAQKRYRKFVNAFVNKKYGNPLEETAASTVLGGIDFVDEIKDKYLDGKKVDRNLPEESTWDDLMHEIYVRQVIESGLEDSKAGRTTDVEQGVIV